MEPFYLSYEEFWHWFEQDKSSLDIQPMVKRMKTKHEQISVDISTTTHKRYICLYGKHRPGKKTKVWEGDGYLSITSNNMGHLCDLRGRLLEDPVVMEVINLDNGEELRIGEMEVQIVELCKT